MKMLAATASVSSFTYSGRQPIEASIGWITGTLLGTAGLILCILAIASVGFLMLTGRLPVRHGLRVVLGCFILLGAPVIASAFLAAPGAQPMELAPAPAPQLNDIPRGDLPPSGYDPYAGASFGRD